MVILLAVVTFLNPADQPTGKHRLINELKACLDYDNFSNFKLAVAFAKVGPLLRLESQIIQWRKQGKSIDAIFGIDHLGTSLQALEFALNNFDNVYITHSKISTFHPKLYLFHGEREAVCYYGSHNLTVGGTETNFEGGVKLQFDLTTEEEFFNDALNSWSSLLPANLSATNKLDQQLLKEIINQGLLLDEVSSIRRQSKTHSNIEKKDENRETKNLFGSFYTKPASPLPKNSLLKVREKKEAVDIVPTEIPDRIQPVESLIIQIVPHHNGEVFLSKIAVNQNPDFFGFPFTGQTVPKKSQNKSYPQREPDPIVNFYVFDENGNLTISKENHPLNMVYYSLKSEIRITFPPEVLRVSPPYSIMVMSPAKESATYDYQIEIFAPGSEKYEDLLTACNQTLPSGGSPQARKMGWI